MPTGTVYLSIDATTAYTFPFIRECFVGFVFLFSLALLVPRWSLLRRQAQCTRYVSGVDASRGRQGVQPVNDATPRLGGYPHTQTHILYSLSLPFLAPFLCSACVCFGSNIARRQKEISIRKSKRGFALGVIQCIHGRKNYIWWCIDCILLYSFRWKHIFCSFCSIHSYSVFFFLVSFDISDIIHLLSALIFIE